MIPSYHYQLIVTLGKYVIVGLCGKKIPLELGSGQSVYSLKNEPDTESCSSDVGVTEGQGKEG